MRKSSIAFASVGTIAAIMAFIVWLVIYPKINRLPGDLDNTHHYEGTGAFLNAEAVQSGDVANILAKDVPVKADRVVKVVSTDGNTAVVTDDVLLDIPGQDRVPDQHRYAMDRKTMDADPAPEGEKVEQHKGLTFTWPLEPKPDDRYGYYDPTTRTTADLKYVGEGKIEGRSTYIYEATATGELKNEATLATLPKALPKALLVRLAGTLPSDVAAQLAGAAAALPDNVPLTYTATRKIHVDADQRIGNVLRAKLDQEIVATIDVAGTTVPLMPVSTTALTSTSETMADAADDASDGSRVLLFIGSVTPIGLAAIAVVLWAVASLFWRRKPAAAAAATAAPEPDSGRSDD